MWIRTIILAGCLGTISAACTDPAADPPADHGDGPLAGEASSAIAPPPGRGSCGDGICALPDELTTCPADCGGAPACGDKVCNGFETTNSCPADCGTLCGDGACNGGETADSCAADCVVPHDAPFDATVLRDGGTWQLKTLSGRAQDPATGKITPFKGNYWFVQAAGIESVPLSPTVKPDLADLAQNPSAALTVSDAIVAAIDASLAQGFLTPELAAIAEPEDAGSPTDARAARSRLARPLSGCADAFHDYAKSIGVNTPFSYTTNPGSGFSGTISGSGGIQASGTGEIEIGIRRFKLFGACIPYAAYFSHAHIFGGATIGGASTITGTASFANSWDWEIAKVPLFSLSFFIGPLPVYIGFNLPINVGLDLQASVTGAVTYTSSQSSTGAFDYLCTMGGCSGSTSFSQSSTTPSQSVTGSISGRIQPTVWAQLAIRGYLYDEWFAYAQVGVRPALQGDLWGYAGNTCGDANADGIAETVHALTLDLDVQLFLTAQARVFGATPTQWNDLWHTARHHLGFWDLVGSDALRPMLGGVSTSAVNLSKPYTAKMRPCYPYADNVSYAINWGDGTSSTTNGPAQSAVTVNHAWTTAGTKVGTLTAVSDAHGRTFNQATARSFSVASDPCPVNATWLGVSHHAVFDGANCLVGNVPNTGGTPFMWANNYYISPNPGTTSACSFGGFDGANCFLGSPPPGKTGFLFNNAFYFGP